MTIREACAEVALPLRGARWDRIPKAALWLLLILLVVPNHDELTYLWRLFSPWNNYSLAGAALVLLAVIGWSARDRTGRPGFLIPAALFAAAVAASAAANRIPLETAIVGLRATLPFIVFGLAAARFCEEKTVQHFLRTMAIVGAFLAAYSILSFLAFRAVGGFYAFPANVPRNIWETVLLYPYYYGAPPGRATSWRLMSNFMNEYYFGVWMAMLVPLTFALTLNTTRKSSRLLGFTACTLMVIAATWTYSRAAFLALAVAVGVFAWRSSPRAFLLLLPLVLAAPLFVLSIDVLRFTDLAGTEGGRLASVGKTLEVLQSRPVFGNGPGTRGLADMNYAKIGYETGLLGLGAFLWVLASAVAPAIRVRSKDPARRRVVDAILAAMLAVIVAAVGGEVFETPHLAYYFWVLAGLLWALQRPHEVVPGAATPGGKHAHS